MDINSFHAVENTIMLTITSGLMKLVKTDFMPDSHFSKFQTNQVHSQYKRTK